jgi:predicted O-methyltransferase YrrM
MLRDLFRLQESAWRVAARAALLPLSSLLSRTERKLLWEWNEVGWGARRSGVYPEVSLASLMERGDEVRLLELPAEIYHLSEIKLMTLAALTARARARVVFEVGTADGRTTRNLAANVGPDGHVYTLNIPLEQDAIHRRLQDLPVGSRFRDSPEADRITQLWGDSRSFDFTPYLQRCQVVFLDAESSDAAVWADSQSALRLVDRGAGLIVWNDALSYGWVTALPRLMRLERLPIHLISAAGLAVLCFADGVAMEPRQWSERLGSRPRTADALVDG